MDRDQEIKRLKRALAIFGSILMFMVFAFITVVSFWISDVKNSIASIRIVEPRVIQGIDGKNGLDGKDGMPIVGPTGQKGEKGTDGETKVIYNTTVTNVPVPGPQGEPGPKGEAGVSQIIKFDTVTCQLLSKYEGDDTFKILATLPAPCEATND